MENKPRKETNKEKTNKISNNKIVYYEETQNTISDKKSIPKKNNLPKVVQKENTSKNINNKTLTDWNKRKIYKRIIQNVPQAPKLYLKKRVVSKKKKNLKYTNEKNELSCAHKKIEKYTKKVAYDSKNVSKKKNMIKNISHNSDIEFEFELEKDIEAEDESVRINAPHMTNKKKYNYFFSNPKTETKVKDYNATTNNIFKEKSGFKIDQNVFYRAKRYLLNNKNNNLINKKNLCENRYENTSSNKKNMRAKTEKKKGENKENFDSNRNNNHNNKNIVVFNDEEYIYLRQVKRSKMHQDYKKEADLNQLNSLFNSLNINKEAKINKIINLHTNNSNINNKFKIKKYNLNLDKFHVSTKRRNFPKNINLSFIKNSKRDLTITKVDGNIKSNIYYIGNKTSIKNSSSDIISGEETKDSPENITDREDDKSNLSIHKINHFFINLNESKKKKLDKSCNKFNNKNSLIFSNFDLDTDENCLIHKTNVSVVNMNKKISNENNNISSYKKNIERFRNLTSERKIPLSLFLSPSQKSNLFKGKNEIKFGIKNLNFIKNSKNNKINLIDLFVNKRDKKDNIIKACIEKFLDFKSLLQLSSTNRSFFKNVRSFLFKYIYNNSIGSYINRKDQKIFITKIITSLFKHCSIKIKSKKELKNIYYSYKTKSKYDLEITKDLTRTFPKDKSFSKDSKNSKKLYNILTSYSNYNKNIGYAQGLNFIAAIAVCMFDNEEICFMFLDSLINRFELKNYLSIDNKNLIGKLSHFSKYLNKYIPEIISFLDKHDINHGFFSHGWILTLFSNSMKKEYLIHTWAFMIIFGWKFFYSFVIQVLLWYKKDIFKANINSLCDKMKNILADDDFRKNYKNIIKNTFSFMNKYIYQQINFQFFFFSLLNSKVDIKNSLILFLKTKKIKKIKIKAKIIPL